LIRWREKFWGRRYQAILVSNEAEAQIARLRYVLAHGVKEGLVASPLDWPGAHCAKALLEGAPVIGRWIDRTLEYEYAAGRKRLPVDVQAFVTMEQLHLAPLPCWRGLSDETLRGTVRELVDSIEQQAVRREQDTGRSPLGRSFIFRQDPRHEPIRSKKGPAPLVHAASRAVRLALREAYGLYLAGYRRAADRLRRGALDALFPEGSFPPPLPFRAASPGG
jgi:hypothetical protein